MHWFEDEFISEEEDVKATKSNWRIFKRLIPYFRKYVKTLLIAAVLLLSSTLLTLLGPILIKRAIDVEVPQKSIQGLLIIVLVYVVIQIFIIVVRYFQQIEIMSVGERAIADLKSNVFRRLLNIPVAYFDKNPVGRLISRVESDTETLKFLFSSTAVVLIQSLALILGMSVVMLIVNVHLYLLILILLPVFLGLFLWFERHVRPIYVALRKKIAELNAFIVEAIKNLSIVQAFRQEQNFVLKIEKLGKEKYDNEMKALSYWYRTWGFVELGEIIGIILVLGVGGIWALQGLITIGSLYLFLSYIIRIFEPLRGLSEQINVIERSFASAERVFNILSTRVEQTVEETETLKSFQREIEFKDLGFFYEEKSWVLKDLNFSINRGERIALVGETGGGKTSIVSLLLKFYTPKAGEIFIDNCRIARLDRGSLRSKIGFVPQDVILFPGSILDNLRLFDERIPAQRVYESAKRAKIHGRICGLPKGYETNIVEQGINLSFGEKQLLSYARALVFDPEILILDEATSSVDPGSERLVQDGMRELLKDRTAIIIAHRLTTTRLADRVLVVHRGRLVEQGTHEDLVSKRGYYYQLYNLQYLGESL